MERVKDLKEKVIVLSNFNKVLGKKNKNLQEQADRYAIMVQKYRTRINKAIRLLEKERPEDALDILKGEYSEYKSRRNRKVCIRTQARKHD